PAEIVAASPFVVTAPIDAVIRQVVVNPNTRVKKGDPLVRFEDVSLRNRLEVASQEATLARARLKKYYQAAFNDPEAKRELRAALAEVQLKEAEAAYARDLLSQTVIRAPRDGLVVFNDKKDWTGRPVSVGQRIMEIANPRNVRLKIEMPVNDAIVVARSARVRVYLDSDPLNPLNGKVLRASHEARPSDSGIMAYELTAIVDPGNRETPRLGIRGTAQVYGEKAPLFFYLFRRPLSALRQRFGL
ncbi:MAG TPA: HlyD family secretion protein, partial [Rhizobiales bacterium]|nr:HlyD family secretion protein [Hyphomicrobiales bacterium]